MHLLSQKAQSKTLNADLSFILRLRRSQPPVAYIGLTTEDRIRVHLCCYYRSIGVFVYWLTESTDIESDNRHYCASVPAN